MKLSHQKNITSLLLVLFLSMKIAGLHAFTHSEDKEHIMYCAMCDAAISHNLTPTLTPDFSDLEITTTCFVVYKERDILNGYKVYQHTILRELFSRPPPFKA